MDPKNKKPPEPNRDPITEAPRAHPAGVGAGAMLGGTAGAAIGTAAGGPLGGVVGAAIGAVAGGAAGNVAAEAVNPTVEEAYWQKNWSSRPYADPKLGYEHYRPAYRYGWESRMMRGESRWDEVEPELAKSWQERRGHSALDWAKARLATRDAWERLEGRPGEDPERKDH